MNAVPVRCEWGDCMTLAEKVGHKLVVAVKGRPPVTFCHGQAALPCDVCRKVTIWEGDDWGAPTRRLLPGEATAFDKSCYSKIVGVIE